ncbi:MAG: hypothetical protein ACSLEL_03550 [Candidatus Malihini olakiniferum]
MNIANHSELIAYFSETFSLFVTSHSVNRLDKLLITLMPYTLPQAA